MLRTALLLGWMLTTMAWVQAEPRVQVALPNMEEPELRFSPDGRRLTVQLQHQVHVLDRGGVHWLRSFGGFHDIFACSMNPGGSLLAIGDYPRMLRVVRPDSGQTAWSFAAPPEGRHGDEAGALEPQFSPGGNWLLVSGASHGLAYEDRQVRLFDGLSGHLAHHWLWGGKFRDGTFRMATWSWDGKWIVRLVQDQLQIHAPSSGKRVAQLRLPGDHLDQQSTPEGCVVAYRTQHDTSFARVLYALPHLERRQFAPGEGAFPRNPAGNLQWTPGSQGEPVVTAGSTEVYRGQPGELVRTWVPGGGFVLAHPDGAMHLFSADGKDLGISSWDRFSLVPGTPFAYEQTNYGGPQRFYDFRTAKKLGGLAYSSGTAITRDGRRLAVTTRRGVLVLDVPLSLAQGKLRAAR